MGIQIMPYSEVEMRESDAQFKKGQIYLSDKMYSLALSCFLKSAVTENAGAQFAIGKMYFEGLGIRKNRPKGIEWFSKAATRDHIKALNYLGNGFLYGMGTRKDHIKAVGYFQRAAEKGSDEAYFNLGEAYYSFKPQDFRKAFEYYYTSASMGHPRAIEGVRRFICRRTSRMLVNNNPSSSVEITTVLPQTINKLKYVLLLLIGLHNTASFFSETAFLLPEYCDLYKNLFERVKRYDRIVTLLQENPDAITSDFELTLLFKDSAAFPNSTVRYDRDTSDKFSARYYSNFDAWAFGEKNVSIADEIARLYIEIYHANTTELHTIEFDSPYMIKRPAFVDFLLQQRRVSQAIKEESEWPGEIINLKMELENTIDAFENSQRKRRKTSAYTIAERGEESYRQENSNGLGMKASFLTTLIKQGHTVKHRDEIICLFTAYVDEVLGNQEQWYSEYKQMPQMLHEMIATIQKNSNTSCQRKFFAGS